MKEPGLAAIAVAAFLAGCAVTPATQEGETASAGVEWGKEYNVEVLETVEEFGFFNGYVMNPLTASAATGVDPALVKYVSDQVRSGLEEQGLLISAGQKIELSGEILPVSFVGDRALMKARIQLADAHNELPLSTVEVESRAPDRARAGEVLSLAIVEYLSGLVKEE
jgi:hypothetical protein